MMEGALSLGRGALGRYLAALEFRDFRTLWSANLAARAAQTSTSQALAANLVPRHRLLNALSLSSATQHGARLVGPGLAAPLLALLGAPAAFFLCTFFYGFGWFQVRRIATISRGGVE